LGYSTSDSLYGPQKRLESITRLQRGSQIFASATIPLQYGDDRHGFLVGEAVAITKAGHFDNIAGSGYNGHFKITAVTGQRTFEYELPADPGEDSENQDLVVLGTQGFRYCLVGEAGIDSENQEFSAGYFGRIWQSHRLLIENNVIELGIRTLGSVYGHAVGLPIFGSSVYAPQFSIVRLIARGNLINNVNDAADPSSFSLGVEMSGCERALIEQNIISLPRLTPIEHNTCGEIRTLNNVTPDGLVLQSVSRDFPTPINNAFDVGADLEDSKIASLLKPKTK
jgi:hypothetical protein